MLHPTQELEHPANPARVRKHVRIHLPVGPEDKDFANYYHAARAGEKWLPAVPKAVKGSIDWLCAEYLSFIERMLEAEQMSPATLKQRRSVLRRIEIMFGRLKDWRRVAIRYDRCPKVFLSAIALAATVMFWL